MTLAEKLTYLRKSQNLTQQDIADYLHVDKSTYAHYEKGDRKPNVTKLQLLASFYGLTDELLGADEVEVSVICPAELLDELEKQLLRYDNANSLSYSEIIDIRTCLKSAAEPVLNFKSEAIDFNDYDRISDRLEKNFTKSVRLDRRMERLLFQYYELQNRLLDQLITISNP